MTRAVFLAAVLAFAPSLPEGCAKALGKGKAPQTSASADASTSSAPVATATATAAATGTATASAPAIATAVATPTAPPVWAPPDTGGPLPTPPPPAPSVSPDAVKARALADSGEHKKVRALLEKKVKAGKGTNDEAAVLMESCIALRDKACIDAVKAKHPAVE